MPPALNCAASYTRRTAAYSWYDTASAYPWDVFADDDLQAFQLPFPFLYFGQRYEWVTVASNGWISFIEPAATYALAESNSLTWFDGKLYCDVSRNR